MQLANTRQWLGPIFASPLSRAFAFIVIATSTAITLIVTSIQLWFDYETSVASTQDTLTQIEASYSSSLSTSLWTYNEDLVHSQLEGIANLTEIEWVEIGTEDGTKWAAGQRQSTYTLERKVPLYFGSGLGALQVGQLTLVSSLDSIYWHLAEKFVVVLFLNLIKTLCMSVVIIYLFHRTVGRHLIDLASYLEGLSLSEKSTAFRLRNRRKQAADDELDQLADAINVMRANIRSSYDTVTRCQNGLEAALQKERELSGLQRQFVSMVSHEFRTPLAIIDGNAQRLERKKASVTPEKLSGVLTKIRRSVVRLTDLMESILSSSRLEDGRIKCELADCDIAALLQDICGSYRDLNIGHQIIDEVEGLPPIISADEKLLRQVFSNLLSNAVKYAPEGTSVLLKACSDSRNNVVVSVRDQGVGIPENEIEKLFERFFRASTSTGIPGTGIGLHLVKHLIEMHRGSITVDSSPNEGSTFTVYLPTERTTAAPTAVDQSERGQHGLAEFAASAAS